MSLKTFGAVLVSCLLAGSWGCGSDEPAPAPQAATPIAKQTDTASEKQANKDEPAADDDNAANAKEGKQDPNATGKPDQVANQPEEPEKPARPEAIADWVKEDYISAKLDGDKRLPDAVRHLADRFPGNDAAAGLLVELLRDTPWPEPPVDETPPESDAESKPASDSESKTKPEPKPKPEPKEPVPATQQTATAIVESLGNIKAPAAAKALGGLLIGKVESPLVIGRRVALVLAALNENNDYPPHEDLLFQLVTTPEMFTSDLPEEEQGRFDARRLRSQTIALAGTQFSAGLRTRLANYLANLDAEQFETMIGTVQQLLTKNIPECYEAQSILFRAPVVSKLARSRLQATIVANSRRSLEMLLGIPSQLENPPGPGDPPAAFKPRHQQTTDGALQYSEFTNFAWTPKINVRLVELIGEAGDPADAPEDIALLASMPLESSRFTMSELLSYQAYRGAQSFRGAGLFGRSATDPALVPMFKSLYHDAAASRRVVRSDDRPAVSEDKQKTWEDGVATLVENWMKRMYSTARAIERSGEKPASKAGEAPVVLHKDAKIAYQLHQKWPDDVAAKLPNIQLAPMEIHYLRIEEVNDADRLISRYQRYAGRGRGKSKKINGGEWLDGLGNGSTPKSKRSVDIRITSKEKKRDAFTAKGTDDDVLSNVVIEILTIEIPEIVEPDGEKQANADR